jgi:hypothetical protein
MDLVYAAMIASGFLCAGVIVCGSLAKSGRRALRIERTLAAFHREWSGVPARDGEPAQPGVMARLSAQDAQLAELKKQLATLASKDKGRCLRHGKTVEAERGLMDSALITLLANAGVAGVVIVLIVAGILVPKPYYTRLEEENKLLREGRDIDRQRASEAASTAGVTNQLIGALTNLATERHAQNTGETSGSPDGKARRPDLTWGDLT